MIRRMLMLLLAVALLLPSAVRGEEFSADTITEARMKALEAFRVCAFSAEYNSSGRDFLVRWDKPIRICTSGNMTSRDSEELDSFIMDLGLRVPMLPPVTRVWNKNSADIVIYYCNLDEMAYYIPGYVEGNWGYFSFNYENWRIVKASIGIAVDVCTQQERNHLMKEELVGALGLANDHYLYSDSILYQEWTTVQDLSEVDWLMLNYLYSPLTKPADKWPAVQQAIRKFYGF